MWILYPKNLKNFTKSAISPFALFVQSQSPKKHHVPHFSIFLLEILNTASQLNLAAYVRARFLNFDCWWEINVMLLSFWFRFFGPLLILAGKRAKICGRPLWMSPSSALFDNFVFLRLYNIANYRINTYNLVNCNITVDLV